jgi:hypothetical protein
VGSSRSANAPCHSCGFLLRLNDLPILELDSAFFFENYHLNLKASAIFLTEILFAGFIGDIAGGLVSDYILRKTGN